MCKEVEDLERRINDCSSIINNLVISQRKLSEEVKLLHIIKRIDAIMFRNMLHIIGGKTDWYDDKVNDAMLVWRKQATKSLPKEIIPEDMRREIISHVEETEVVFRDELVHIKEKFENEVE